MKKIATLLVILGTMTCHVMAQEINVESLLKKADDAAKLADKYPKDGLKQIYAAEALTNIALNEKRDFDRAQTYTSSAGHCQKAESTERHPVGKDILSDGKYQHGAGQLRHCLRLLRDGYRRR